MNFDWIEELVSIYKPQVIGPGMETGRIFYKQRQFERFRLS